MKFMLLTSIFILAVSSGVSAAPVEKVCGIYTSILSFAGRNAMDDAINSQPGFLMDKHKSAMAGINTDGNVKLVIDAGFNTVFMTIYPLWGREWWEYSAAKGLIKDALAHTKGQVRVHIGFSMFNAWMCQDPSKYPGALRTIQCDGTRPSWVCFFDDSFWAYLIRNAVELAAISVEIPDSIDGIFIDPESYGPECYLCFCNNCVRKFNKYSNQKMPTDLVKPDSWLHARGLWKKYTVEWHDYEVRRHAIELRETVHKINPELQLSSLLWDYPVAVGIGDPRQQYFRNLAIGLGTKKMPSWTLPEHTYYSDGPDLDRIIKQIDKDIQSIGGQVQVLPGIRILRQPASTLIDRGKVIRDSKAVGYWFYELGDLMGKGIIDFEGEPVEPIDKYWNAFKEMNRIIREPQKQGKAGL